MADFYTNKEEELLINNILTKGLEYKEKELPKYIILRLAIAKALNLELLPLNSPLWHEKRIQGEKEGGKEYHLEQITGKNKKESEDFDLILKALFYIKHKEELLRDKKDIFSDEIEYRQILDKYIKRGLFELKNSWKSSDCFYQWCLDNLNLKASLSPLNSHTDEVNDKKSYFERVYKFFKKEGVEIKLINEFDSIRHRICRVELLDSLKINAFKSKIKNLDDELGCKVLYTPCEGLSKTYDIQIAKDPSSWQSLSKQDYELGLKDLTKHPFKLGIFAGFDVSKKPFCFDLESTPHLLVAGTTGSGKTSFMCMMIDTLLRQNAQIIIIDPKQGVDYKRFLDQVELIADMSKAENKIDELIQIMEARYKQMSESSHDEASCIVLFIDELNDLVQFNKNINDKLSRLAQKARQAKIHLVLGSQRPDSKSLDGNLRSNIPSRISLQVQKSNESKIILDETGAEKLLGRGDMLIKLVSMPQAKYIISAPFK